MHVDQDGDGGIDGGDGFDGQHGIKEGAAGAAHLLGNLDAHQAQFEELGDEAGGELLLVVHGADERGDGFLSEAADGSGEQQLLFRELRERGGVGMSQMQTASGMGVYQKRVGWRQRERL